MNLVYPLPADPQKTKFINKSSLEKPSHYNLKD